MSLLFYDFNHHNQKAKTATAGALSSAASNNPQNGAFGQHLSNLADVVIPEEAAEDNLPKDQKHSHNLNDDDSIEERSNSDDEDDQGEDDDQIVQQQNSPYIMTIEDEQLLSRQDTLLKEIFNIPPLYHQIHAPGDSSSVRHKQNNSTLGLPQPKTKPLLVVSPRDNQAVEMVN